MTTIIFEAVLKCSNGVPVPLQAPGCLCTYVTSHLDDLIPCHPNPVNRLPYLSISHYPCLPSSSHNHTHTSCPQLHLDRHPSISLFPRSRRPIHAYVPAEVSALLITAISSPIHAIRDVHRNNAAYGLSFRAQIHFESRVK